MKRKGLAAILLAGFTAACSQAADLATALTAPSSIAGVPQVQHVAIQGVSLTRSPLRIFFTGNWEGPEVGQRDHELTRPDLPTGAPWGPITTAAQLEAYLNQEWFPQEFRDVNGARTGFALIDIISFSPTDVDWLLCISDFPIASCP